MTRLAAKWYDALFEVRLQNPRRVAALADDMQAPVDQLSEADDTAAVAKARHVLGRANVK